MKRISLLLAFGVAFAAAADDAIFVHEYCPENTECRVFLTTDGTPPVSATAKPSMRIDNGNIQAIGKDVNEDERVFFRIHFTDEAMKEFAALTGRNVGRQIFFVVNGRLLMAPTVQERVPGGVVLLTAGLNDDLEAQIPWMAERARRAMSVAERLRQWKHSLRTWHFLAFAALWLLVSGLLVSRHVRKASAQKPTQ